MPTVRQILASSPYLEVGVRQVYWGSPILPSIVTKVDALRSQVAKKKDGSPAPTTDVDRVIEALRQWGVRSGDLVLLHSGFRGLRGGGKSPAQVLDAFLDLVGPKGTLCTPSIPYWPEAPKLYERMVADVSKIVLDYDPESTPAWTGALPNAMIRHPKAVRSLHPLNTMVAIGPLARAMVAHDLDGDKPFPNGPQSSWQFCHDHDAWIVCVGADMAHSLTMIHLVEDVAGSNWPVKDWYRERTFRIKVDGNWISKTVQERHPKWAKHYAERTLSRDLHHTGICRQTSLDGVNLEILKTKEMVGYLRQRNHDLYPYFMIPRSARKERSPTKAPFRALRVYEIPNTRALAQTERLLILAGGSEILEFDLTTFQQRSLARLPQARVRGVLAGPRQALARLLRVDTTVAHVQAEGEYLVGNRDGLFSITSRGVRPVSLPEGVRPFKLTSIQGLQGFEDRLVFGDYRRNADKASIFIRGQHPGADTWEVLHEFPAGAVNHVHAIVPDHHRNVCWILTGDYDNAAAIWMATDNFNRVEPILRGDQLHRSCVMFPLPNGLLYATDSHLRANSIRWAQHRGSTWTTSTLASLSGSCLYGAPWRNRWAFTTTVEPGEPSGRPLIDYLDPRPGPGITGPGPQLVVGDPENGFFEVLSYPAPSAPRRLLGFSYLGLPTVYAPSDFLAVSTVGLGHEDCTTIYRLEET